MYFYVDESGNTGLNLFDENQPMLYYGTLDSRLNLDALAENTLAKLRRKLDVKRLHAAELGNGPLVEILPDLLRIAKKFNVRFNMNGVAKADHALIGFFDQVFDQGMNPAVPWTAYWTPLRYMLLGKLASLFDDDLLKEAWKARITVKNQDAERILRGVCSELINRVHNLPDQRSIELITDALTWTIDNTSKLGYNVDVKKDALQISPNLIGFQTVMHGIAARLKSTNKEAKAVIVDQQSQFNAAQEFVADFYHKTRNVAWSSGPGLPVMELQNMPKVPITCIPGDRSAGLELVDIYIWIFKRYLEGADLAPELHALLHQQRHKARYDEVSINGILNRWEEYFSKLPEPSAEELEQGRAIHELQEVRRKAHLSK